MVRLFPKSNLSHTRLWGSMSAMWLVYGLLELSKRPHKSWVFALELILTLVFTYNWIGYTAIRLTDLRVSRMWVLPIIVPTAIFALALYAHWSLVDRISLIVTFAVQLPLWLLPSRRNLAVKIESSDVPNL